jgi:hypothetical protein
MKWNNLRPSHETPNSAALRAAEHASRCQRLADWCEAMAAWNAGRGQWLAARDWANRQRVFRQQAAQWAREAAR